MGHSYSKGNLPVSDELGFNEDVADDDGFSDGPLPYLAAHDLNKISHDKRQGNKVAKFKIGRNMGREF